MYITLNKWHSKNFVKPNFIYAANPRFCQRGFLETDVFNTYSRNYNFLTFNDIKQTVKFKKITF